MKKSFGILGTLAVLLMGATVWGQAEIIEYDRNVDYSQYIRPDRYLNAEVWTDNNEYYQGENIKISFRVNKDCYVAVYDIDTRGQVNLIYPTQPGDDGHIQGDRIYRIPEKYDDYELTVRGPAGVEYLQIIASREPLELPDWFNGSGLVCDGDPYDFMDYINGTYFGCQNDCPRALDLTSFSVKEWHEYYFHPVYYNDYPDWSVCGSVYVDYPFGATIYIDGIYWGVAPLFIPRLYWGHHWMTVVDPFGYCWEDRISVVRYKSVIIDDFTIKTRSGLKSRFRDIQRRGYLDPVKNGYPEYHKQIRVKETYKSTSKNIITNTVGKKGSYDRGTAVHNKYETGKRRSSYDSHRQGSKKESTGTQYRDNSTGKRQSTERVIKQSETKKTDANQSRVQKKKSGTETQTKTKIKAEPQKSSSDGDKKAEQEKSDNSSGKKRR